MILLCIGVKMSFSCAFRPPLTEVVFVEKRCLKKTILLEILVVYLGPGLSDNKCEHSASRMLGFWWKKKGHVRVHRSSSMSVIFNH